MDGSIDFDCYSLGRGDMITLIMLHQLKSISAKVSENTFLGMWKKAWPILMFVIIGKKLANKKKNKCILHERTNAPEQKKWQRWVNIKNG